MGYQRWCSICSPAFVAIAGPHVPSCWYIQAASVAGIQVTLVFLPNSLVCTSYRVPNCSHQLDFLIPCERHGHSSSTEKLFTCHWAISEILNWKQTGSNWSSFYFLMSQHTTITSTKLSKHQEKWFVAVSFLVLNITFIWPYLPSYQKRWGGLR